MRDLNQLILKLNYENNFKDNDFYVSKSNKHIFDLLLNWPKWDKNFLNISGERCSGKTHLVKIFTKKFQGIILNADTLNNSDIKNVKIYQNIILDDLSNKINEELFYSLINIIEQDNKYLIVTSRLPIVNLNFNLNDLKSRAKSFLLYNVEKPDDEMMFAIILKNLSDKQISLDKKLIDFIIKRIDRSYSKIFEFIYKIDELSLKKKKSIDLKIIKEVLEDC
tara:strand:- start:578 stop:1243 length:666 start_codon:yes stop_codon:yes gene_type:complete